MAQRCTMLCLLLISMRSRPAHAQHADQQHWDHSDAYLLLGAPTSLCWRNAAKLEADYPPDQVQTRSTRPGINKTAPAHLCSLPSSQALSAADDSSGLQQLLQHARALMPCRPGLRPCNNSQLHSIRIAFHSAAHSTLRFYIPPGAFSRQQLTRNLAMNPLICGLDIYKISPGVVEPRSHEPGQPAHVDGACRLLPGLLPLMGSIAARGEAVDCRWDPTLPDLPGKVAPPLLHSAQRAEPRSWWQRAGWMLSNGWARRGQARQAPPAASPTPAPHDQHSHQHFLVAFALHNKQQLMPHFILQVLSLVAYLPANRVLVSCYESGSTDDTPKWLELLQGLLDLLHVPNHIMIQGNLTRGGMPRIAFLAAIRNAILAPLHDASIFAKAAQRASIQHTQAAVFPADKIIFINDPYFSWQDMLRLAHHDVDIACGLDLIFHYEGPPARKSRRRLLQEHQPHLQRKLPPQEEAADEWWSWNGGARSWHPFHAGRQLLGWVGAFYDFWVARDIVGLQFMTGWPVVADERGQKLMNQGLPAPVQCCWNAAVVLNAAPFRPGGIPAGAAGNHKPGRLVFRSGSDGDCDASECSLMCNDFWKLGYRRVLSDPTVRVTYDPYPRAFLHESTLGGAPMLSWRQMRSKLQEQQINLTALLHHPEPVAEVNCCPILRGGDAANWSACFRDSAWYSRTRVGVVY